MRRPEQDLPPSTHLTLVRCEQSTVPVETEVLGPEVSEVERLATPGINARGDADLLKVWLKSRQDGASHRAVLSSHRARLRQQTAHTYRRPSFAGQDRSERRHIRQGENDPLLTFRETNSTGTERGLTLPLGSGSISV